MYLENYNIMRVLENKYGKIALYVIGGLIVMYLMIYVFTPKSEIPLEYKHALDSLNRANAELIIKQKQIDSAIASYQSQIHDLDYAISNIQTKKTEIINHYQVLGGKVSNYEPTQVDSFFKARYNY
jgi:hypothetical protein